MLNFFSHIRQRIPYFFVKILVVQECWSQSCETAAECESASFLTLAKPLSNEAWVAKPSEISPDETNESSTKLRKVVKEHED